jgi:hypothetical protein
MKLKDFVKRINDIELVCEIGVADGGTLIIHAVVPGTHKSLASFTVDGDTVQRGHGEKSIEDVIHELSGQTFCN